MKRMDIYKLPYLMICPIVIAVLFLCVGCNNHNDDFSSPVSEMPSSASESIDSDESDNTDVAEIQKPSGFSYEKERENRMTDECMAILNFLNCEYELFANDRNGDNIIARFNDLATQGKANGFYPLIIIPSDNLAEILDLFVEGNAVENTPEGIAAYRQTVIESAKAIDAATFLSAELNQYLEDYAGYEILGQFVPSEPQTGLSLHMLAYTDCEEVIIAKIPTSNPWELAAWIPMGGFNDCPKPEEQIAVFRYWHEKYGAVPAVVSCDIWEMTLTNPPLTDEGAESLAKEHFAFCCDIVMQGSETIRALASTLKNSTLWYFGWD